MKRNASVAGCLLTVIVLLTPFAAYGQCQPATLTPANPSSANRAPSAMPQFYDEPGFVVAGVADATNLGGHGSDAVVRTKESLARDTVALSGQPANDGSSPKPAAAEKSLREAVQRDSQNFDAHHQLGKLLAGNGKTEEGIPYLERADQLNPDNYDNSYSLASAYASAGRYEQSQARLQLLLARAADRAEAHHLLADVEERLKHPLEAAREYQRAAELNPSEPYLFDWGTELLAHRAPDPAIEVFDRGNRLFPSSTRMLVGLGVAWHAWGSYDQAVECLCRASDLNPSDPTPYLFLAKMQSASTIPSAQVVDKLARFATVHPGNALANYYYAAALWKGAQSAPDAAARAQVRSLLANAVRLDPKLAVAHLLQGIIDSDAGDFQKAIPAFQRAIQAGPQLEEPHYRLAQAYRRMGEKVKAQQELQLYQDLSKKAAAEAERERLEIPQFVIALREAKPTAEHPAQP